ncbi:MAG: 3-deoxy-manno-octulosonate cytidylyltransferase [Candidatus Omnitrophota bacterium]
MEAVGIIPARYGSTRLEAKVLRELCGKPLIQHVYERAKRAKTLDDLIVATDDDRVIQAVESFGGKAVFTSKAHQTGTDRLAEVANELDVRIVLNIQGDEPLIHPLTIDDLVRTMQNDPAIQMATVVKKSFSPEEFKSRNVVKAIVNDRKFAMYFSRSPVPTRLDPGPNENFFYKHLGIYAYTKDFLFTFKKLPPAYLETHERLEQLRALENGYAIKVIETKFETVGVDTAEDLEQARALLEKEMAFEREQNG